MISYITGDIFVSEPPLQTLKAWQPFWDCVSILFEFQNSDIDDKHPEWRLYWVAGIALLRTIGHVLAKEDSHRTPIHKREIDALWLEWKKASSDNSIFWKFIETERNNLLKTYTFGASLCQDERGHYVRYADGEDALQLFREAVYWWRYQLNSLERGISRHSS